MPMKPKDERGIDINDFIEFKQTSYRRFSERDGKDRRLQSHNAKPAFTPGAASTRMLLLQECYRRLDTRRTETYVRSLRAYLHDRRTFNLLKRKEVGKAVSNRGASRSSETTSEGIWDLRKGEYLKPMAGKSNRSIVKRLPPDAILRKLDEIPLEQRNILTPTLDSILSEAKIILSSNQTDEYGNKIERTIEGKEMVLLVCRNAAHESKPLLRFVHAWEILHEVALPFSEDAREKWRPPTWEEVCHYAGITADEFIGEFTAAAHRYGVRQAKIVLDLRLSEVVDLSLQSARELGSKGFPDRKMLMEAGGLIQPPGGGGTNVTVNNNSLNVIPGAAQGLPDWRKTQKALEGIHDNNIIEGETEDDLSASEIPM